MMVFFYQIVTKPLTARFLPAETCPVCGKKGGIEIVLYMRYIKAIIPIYGMGRPTGVYCRQCDHILKNPGAGIFAKKKYPQSIADALSEMKATHKRTLWQKLYPWSFWFVMPAIIGILILVAQYERRGREHNIDATQQLLAHPQAGDIYKSMWSVNDGRSSRSESALVKVTRIDGDTLFVVRSRELMRENSVFDKEGWQNFHVPQMPSKQKSGR